MDVFTELFGNLLAFVYHCFDRIVIHGYLSALSRPEQVVHFVRKIVGVPVVSKEILSQRTADYQNWVQAYARNHHTPIEWAEKGVRKRRMANKNAYGVYFIFKSMEQGPSFRISVPKYPTQDPHHPSSPASAAATPTTTSTSGILTTVQIASSKPHTTAPTKPSKRLSMYSPPHDIAAYC